MLPDVLEYEVEITGNCHEGTMTGLYTTVERGSSALGVALAGLVFSVSGYVCGVDGISDQAVTQIYVCVAVVPAMLKGSSILIIGGTAPIYPRSHGSDWGNPWRKQGDRAVRKFGRRICRQRVPFQP